MFRFFLFLSTALFSNITEDQFADGFYDKSRCAIVKDFQKFAKAYASNHYKNVPYSTEPRIPKIIHHIWLGNRLPAIYRKYIDSWKEFHPDWQFRLWTDKDLNSFKFVSGNAFWRSMNFGQRSDILRLEILYRYGGVYVDTDFLCLKPHDPFHHTCDFYIGFFASNMCNALLGSAPKHPIVRRCLEKIKNCSHLSSEEKKIYTQTGPILLSHQVRDYINNGGQGAIAYPPTYFYPFPTVQRHAYWLKGQQMKIVKPYLKENSHSVHLRAMSWNKAR